MDDANKQGNVAENTPRESVSNIFNARFVFQSIWIRCRSVFPNITDRKFMESELRFVLRLRNFLVNLTGSMAARCVDAMK